MESITTMPANTTHATNNNQTIFTEKHSLDMIEQFNWIQFGLMLLCNDLANDDDGDANMEIALV